MFDIIGTTPYKLDGRVYELTNICAAHLFKRFNIDKTYLFQDYYVQADMTPEAISHEVYDTTQYWWVIMVCNNLINPYHALPVSHDLLVEYCKAKYGTSDRTHHFYDTQIKRYCDDVDSDKYQAMLDRNEDLPVYIMPVSVLDYEVEQNSLKHKIKIVNPKFVAAFEEEFRAQFE